MTEANFVSEAQALYPAAGAAVSSADWMIHYNGAQRLVARRIPCLTGLTTVSINITEAGDANDELSAWTVAGATYANTDDGVLYWALGYSAPNATVTIYSDSAGTNAVCTGSADVSAAAATITLAEVASSGISGTVLCQQAPTADPFNASNTLTFERQMLVTNGNRIVHAREVYWSDTSAGTTRRLLAKTEEWLRQRYGPSWRDTAPGTPEYYYLLKLAGGTYICPFPPLDTYDDQVVIDAQVLPTPATATTDVSEMPDMVWDAIINDMARRAALSDENLTMAQQFEAKVQEEILRARSMIVFRAETRGIGIGTDTDVPAAPTWTVRIVSD